MGVDESLAFTPYKPDAISKNYQASKNELLIKQNADKKIASSTTINSSRVGED